MQVEIAVTLLQAREPQECQGSPRSWGEAQNLWSLTDLRRRPPD